MKSKEEIQSLISQAKESQPSFTYAIACAAALGTVVLFFIAGVIILWLRDNGGDLLYTLFYVIVFIVGIIYKSIPYSINNYYVRSSLYSSCRRSVPANRESFIVSIDFCCIIFNRTGKVCAWQGC